MNIWTDSAAAISRIKFLSWSTHKGRPALANADTDSLFSDGACWKERNAALHNGRNTKISQSEYNEEIEEYYKKGMKSQGGMNIYSTRVWRNYCKQVRLNHKNYDFEREPTIRSKNQRNLRHRANIRSIHTYYNTKTKNTTTAATKKCRPQWKVLAHSTLPIQFSS